MSMYEEEAKRALREFASSKYAVPTVKQWDFEKLLTYGIDPFFTGRKSSVGTAKNVAVDASELWEQTNGRTGPRAEGNLSMPSGCDIASVYSRASLTNGEVTFAEIQLPDVDDGQYFYFGFERGGNAAGALFRFYQEGGVEHFEAEKGGYGGKVQMNLDNALPADAKTARHSYKVRVTGRMAEFYVDGDQVAYILNSNNLAFPSQTYPPYAIGGVEAPSSTSLSVIAELMGGEGMSADVFPPANVRFSEGEPYPPRNFRLYDEGASTLMTSGTYDTGTSYKSHPVPIFGFEGVTLSIRADTASVVNGLTTEVLTQEGNWRPIDTYDLGANEFYYLDVNAEFPLMRVGYEPSANGASITDAEVTLR